MKKNEENDHGQEKREQSVQEDLRDLDGGLFYLYF